jgi:hypothetical protein
MHNLYIFVLLLNVCMNNEIAAGSLYNFLRFSELPKKKVDFQNQILLVGRNCVINCRRLKIIQILRCHYILYHFLKIFFTTIFFFLYTMYSFDDECSTRTNSSRCQIHLVFILFIYLNIYLYTFTSLTLLT